MAPISSVPPHRRPLPKTLLPSALSTSKTLIYSDTSLSQPTSSSRHHAPVSASSTSTGAQLRSIAWSPLGNLIATADARILRVWNPEKTAVKFSTELKLAPGQGGSAPVTASRHSAGSSAGHLAGTERVAWNPAREAELASVGNDGMLRFWDVRARGGLAGDVKVGGEGFSLAWRPGSNAGNEVVVGTKDDRIVGIDRRALKVVSEQQQSLQTNGIAFTNSGQELLLTTGDGHVKIADWPSLETLHALNAHTSACSVVQICPRGRHIAIGGSDALITVWDTTEFVCRHSLTHMSGAVRSVSFSFDGSYLVGGADEPSDGPNGKGIQVVHVETGESVHTVPTASATPCVAWHPSRYLMAWSGESTGLRIIGTGGAL